MSERRAPVQDDSRHGKPRGTVAWWEHVAAWEDYHRHHSRQDAETIAARGGFGYGELVTHLGHSPTTWVPK